MKIPEKNKDLRRYVWRKKGFQILKYLLWLVAFLCGAFAYNNAHQTYPSERRILGIRLVFWMLGAALLGFLLFRLWTLFTCRSLEGTVIRSALSHAYTASPDPGSADYDFRLNTYLTVRTPRGRRRRIRFEQKPGFYRYYHEGAYIYRFSGLPYPLRNPVRSINAEPDGTAEVPDKETPERFLCVACGHMNQNVSAPCELCGHSLIDPALLWGAGETNGNTERSN